MSSNKIKLPGEIFIVAGLFLVAFSISLMIALGFGVSTISSLPYALNLVVPGISFGAWNLIFQAVLYVMLVSITRKVKGTHMISFIMVLLFAVILDFTKMMIGAVPDEIHLRILLFGGSFLLMCFGIALMITSKMPLLIIDLFSNGLSSYYHTSFRRIKTMFDVSCLTISVAVSLAFMGDLAGIGIGTVVMAVITGTFVQAFGTFLKEHFDIQPYFVKFLNTENASINDVEAKE
ncbi:MAG: DUF6198 family protein [Methanomassiliicoccaceae archaeon]|nr:DUF6198 family protein [Methanomassiliicoccaceae archaeon]